jgi:hypothetical protein
LFIVLKVKEAPSGTGLAGGDALKKDIRFWLSVGMGVAGLAAITGLVVQYYQNQRRLLGTDPRAEQVRELIDEAEHLLAVGRRGGTVLRRARA